MENLLKELKADPLTYVRNLKSPIGIYLRRDVLKEEARGDKALKAKWHKKMAVSQSGNGSWDQLFVHSANNLWNLALLGYDSDDESVRKGLDWLLSIQEHEYRGHPGFFFSGNKKDPRVMRATSYGEFGPGCTIFYQTTYAIHLLHLFGLDGSRQAQTTVRSYLKFWRPDWCGVWCMINVLRVLIEHPLSKESKQVEAGLRYLADRQTEMGSWKGCPFYHVLHALSRARPALAKQQLQRAIPLALRRQNGDGSWGRRTRETQTFLVLDSLKNAGLV